MYIRQKNIRVALDNTCNWLFSTMEYRDWLDRRNIAEHHGLLWIKGKPGAGKSTLMKEALHRAEAKNLGTGTTVWIISISNAFVFLSH
jgi:type II secretory ATPase GspE/PulE/Tfp pilus assembly ATPase PilB-like protein